MRDDIVKADDLTVGDKLAEVQFVSFGAGAHISHVTVKRITKSRVILTYDSGNAERRWVVDGGKYGTGRLNKLEGSDRYHSPRLVRRDSETYLRAREDNRFNNSRVTVMNSLENLRKAAGGYITVEQIDKAIADLTDFRGILVERAKNDG